LPRRGLRAVAVDLRRLPPARGPRLPEGGPRTLPPAPPGRGRAAAMSPLPPAFLAAAAFVLPCAVSWLLTALLIRAAPRLGLVDSPAARKVHARPTPKGGGLAVYAAVAVAACPEPGGLDRRRLLLLGVGLGVVVLGLADDLRPLPWQFRLAVQTAAALVAVFL